MDDALSRLIPTHRIGNDGFHWWVGQVEGTASDEENNKGGYRFKVRIVGDHPASREILDTDKLPWATVMMPVNVPFMPGNIGGGHPQLIPGCWVSGFYLDNDRQKPIIMGSIGVVPGATSTINNIEPNTTDVFKNGVRFGQYSPNPNTDGLEGKDGTAKTGGGLSDGTTRGDGEVRVDTGIKKTEVINDEDWCQVTAEKCKDIDLKTQMTSILGQLLYDIQNNNGNIGTYYTSKVTGRVNSSIGTARGYVNKAISVITEFLARVKGYITTKIQEAVDKLVKAVLAPDETGNRLTPITEWFNNLLKDLGCKMADLGDRLIKWLTNLLMNFINKIYRAAVCQVDELVNGIISKIQQLMSELFDSILGPLQDILGAIAEPLNMIGNAINYILRLLGISCDGPDQTCNKYKQICTSGERKTDEDDKDFLDGLLEGIDNLFGDTPADYTQYVCEEAYTGNPLTVTTIGFAGGVPLPPTSPTKKPKIAYNIDNVTVTEGDIAIFTVTRSGFLDTSSSVKFKTLKNQGTATSGTDYLAQDGILGFSEGETEKTISVQTLVDEQKEVQETFFIRLTTNSPVDNSEVKTVYNNNIGKCTIVEKDLKQPYDPYKPDPVDPFVPISDPPTDNLPDNPNITDGETGEGDDLTPTYEVTANRTTCPEDEFIIYTITTTNLVNGTILYYNLYGNSITATDIVGGELSGAFIISDNKSNVTVGIAEDNTIEDVETLTFAVTGTGATVDVLITTASDQGIDDIDEGVGDTPETVFEEFKPPVAKAPITDDNGGIIEIPIDNPGDPWAEPPVVFVGGEGSGATAVGLLDGNGFLTEVRVQSPGFGYKLNLATDNNVRCIIDAFTILRPGIGYTSVPDMYVNGELGIAEAVINDDGFVVSARILNREITFEKFPAIDIVGGGGYGAKVLPSLACLDTAALSTIGSTKIGTGKYIDCP
tara:strand:- start:1172 stop:3988 length:2817 start_codon:yes stop_codon:yes gene_type:complete